MSEGSTPASSGVTVGAKSGGGIARYVCWMVRMLGIFSPQMVNGARGGSVVAVEWRGFGWEVVEGVPNVEMALFGGVMKECVE